MNVQTIRAIDHARASRLTAGIATNDDPMIALAITEASADPHDSSVANLILALGINVVQTLQATIGPAATIDLLRRTVAQLVEAEEAGA